MNEFRKLYQQIAKETGLDDVSDGPDMRTTEEIQEDDDEEADMERPLPRGGADGLRWEYQTKRDEALFHAAWFADFKERWKRDLYTERLNFQARMDAL